MALTTKWDCPTCTYLNWSSSSKCTLCGTLRPTGHQQAKSTIAKIQQHTQNSLSIKPTTTKPGCGASPGEGSRWTCHECTFSNWSNVAICTMCLTPRNKLTTPTSYQPNEATRKGSKSESIFDYVSDASGETLDIKSKSIKHNRRHSPQHEKKTISAPSKKWRCHLCTYENWPRSVKCSMCYQPRTPSPPLSESLGAVGGREDQCGDQDLLEHSSSDPLHPSYLSPLYSSKIQPSSSKEELRQIRNRLTTIDWLFLSACRGIVTEDISTVRAYLKHGGDRARQLTQDEVLLLKEPSKFTVGSTLVHLAVRFQKSDILTCLLTPAPAEARKRLPSQANPDLANSIRQQVSLCLCQHKGEWPCYFFTQLTTFTLPKDISQFSSSVSQKLLEEIIDIDVQKELQEEAPIINWSNEITDELHSRLYPLWNRTAGDCLLDSALQATWGVVDRDGTLRRALSDTLVDGASRFYERWKETELLQASAQGFSLDEDQLKADWTAILSSADQKGQSLEQTHIFVLAHVLRRPIIVYGVKVVKNFKGEKLGLANFEGIYLPLLWESSFCWSTPIALGYTRGHFSALVGIEQSDSNMKSYDCHVTYLPLVDNELKSLPLHFISEQETSCCDQLIKEYCDYYITSGGVVTARQIVTSQHRSTHLDQLIEEWLDRFFRMDKRHEAASNY